MLLSLVLVGRIIFCRANYIRLATTAKDTTSEIYALQQKMISEECNFWGLSKDYESWMHKERNYAVSLSCALVKLEIKCPCDSSSEYVPVVKENQSRHLDLVVNTDCPVTVKTKEYAKQIEMFETTSEYLCHQAHVDGWSREL